MTNLNLWRRRDTALLQQFPTMVSELANFDYRFEEHRYLKVLTILGTRPEIIRLAASLPSWMAVRPQVVHTGQNFDAQSRRSVFFDELGVRKPDYYLDARGPFGEQIAKILSAWKLLAQVRPDRFLVFGDTNSSLAAVMVKRMGIPVFHMEAGNRCYDDRVPEEINRRIIDHSSDVLMPYTERSRKNLLREGIAGARGFL